MYQSVCRKRSRIGFSCNVLLKMCVVQDRRSCTMFVRVRVRIQAVVLLSENKLECVYSLDHHRLDFKITVKTLTFHQHRAVTTEHH